MSRGAALLIALVVLVPGAGCSRKPEGINPNRADLLRSSEEWLVEEPVRLLRDYVRIDTTEAKGEKEGAEFLLDFFQCAGIESEIVCPAPKRCNLLARLPGRRREGALLLLNHIDVAPVFAGFWTEALPFDGKIKGGFLYGRGAYDMKSLAIAQALAIRNLKRHGIVPASDVLFLAEADEELGLRWGSRWLLENRPEWFADVAWVLNEGGTNEMILRDVRFWALETLQAGYALGEFESANEADLEALAKRWPKLTSTAVSPHPDVVAGFDMLANHLGSPLTGPLRNLERVRRNSAELAVLPDRYGSFLEARLFWSPTYPYPPNVGGSFRCHVVVSVPPGMDPGPFLARILKDSSRFRIRTVSSFSSGPTTASPYRSSSGELTSFAALLKRVTEAQRPGVPFGPVPTFGGYTTSGFFRQRGIPAYGYSPIPMNIADASRRHGLDERIYLRDYLNGVELYEDILEEFALCW